MKYVITNAQKGFPVAVRETVETAIRCVEHLLLSWPRIPWTVCGLDEDEGMPKDAIPKENQ